MELKSTAFTHEGEIPSLYTCDGSDSIPPLHIDGAPSGTKSFVLIMDDPDTPASVRPEQMWDHWLVWNIPAETQDIKEGEEPKGVIGNNTSGKPKYMGPCPPDREHRYFFKWYALDTVLDIPQSSTKEELMKAMEGHVIEKSELMGRYTTSANKSKESSDGKEKVKIGFVSGFTGAYSKVVENQYKGLLLAVEQMNKKGGVLGKEVEVVKKDDLMKADVAEQVTRELIEKDKVHFLLGTLAAPTATAENKVAVEKHIPFIALNQVSAVTEAPNLGPYSFHEGLTPFITAHLVGTWAMKHLGKRTFLVVPDYQWGYESYDAYKKVLAENEGVEVGLIKMPLGFKKEDFAAKVDEIRAAKPEVLIATNFGQDQNNFIAAVDETGLKKDMSIILGVSEISVRQALTQEQLVGMYWGVNFYWSLADSIPTAKHFVDTFRERFDGEYPTGYAGIVYSAAMEFMEVANLVGKYPFDYDAIAKTMEGRTYDHYKGEEWWRPCDHQSFQDLYIMRFKGPEESKDEHDIAEVIDRVKWDLAIEHSCEELGHKSFIQGHFA